MSYYWVKTGLGDCGTVVGTEAEAKEHGEILGYLPYPASPILARHNNDNCPPFCWTPEKCLNNNSCHRNRACDD